MKKHKIQSGLLWRLLYLCSPGFALVRCRAGLFQGHFALQTAGENGFSRLFLPPYRGTAHYILSELKRKNGRDMPFFYLLTAAGVTLASFGPAEKNIGKYVLPGILWKVAVSAAYAFMVTVLLHFARCQANEKPKKWELHALGLLGIRMAAGILFHSYLTSYKLLCDNYHPFVYF